MSTNYYFRLKGIKSNIIIPTTNLNLKDKIQEKMDDFLKQISEIHIGIRRAGWKPLFYKTQYFQSIEELRWFYYSNKDCLMIINEYDEERTFEQLEKELIDWAKNDISAKNYTLGEDCYSDSEGYYFTEYEFC